MTFWDLKNYEVSPGPPPCQRGVGMGKGEARGGEEMRGMGWM